MYNQLTYSGISTKIRAMDSTLLTPQMYEDMAALSSVTEFVTYLKQNTVYGTIFGSADETSLHRGQIERMLTTSVYRDFVKIYMFADKSQRMFLSCYFKSFEIQIIKKYLRLAANSNIDTLTPQIYDSFFSRHSGLNLTKLRDAGTRRELIDSLAGTEYFQLLDRLYHGEETANTAFDYEITLDHYYFKSMWKCINKKMTPDMAQILQPIYGTMIDLLNIHWLYRGRFHYRLGQDRLLDIVIPITWRLKPHELSLLAEAAGPNEFNAICCRSYYFRHYGITDASMLDRYHDTMIHSICSRETLKNPYSIAAVYTYILNKETERRKLTRLLECIRYRLEPSEIIKYINGGLNK